MLQHILKRSLSKSSISRCSAYLAKAVSSMLLVPAAPIRHSGSSITSNEPEFSAS